MSLHDTPPARKPNRLGLYLPFILLVVAMLAWSVFWFWAKGETARRMDLAVAGFKAAGYEITWSRRTLGGYPFRMDIALTDARVREPAGWMLEAPRLEGEAFMQSRGHWMLAAPLGITFVRPVGGAVAVRGELIRASLGALDKRPPSFSFEGVKLTFTPAAGAQPFALAGADRVEFHLRAGPDDEGGVFMTLKNGKAAAGGLLARIAGDKPVAVEWNSTLSKMSAFTGSDWPSAVRHWSAGGGQMTVRKAGFTAGDALVGASAGKLAAGSDGRLTGVLDVTLRQAPRALALMGEAGLIAPENAQAAAVVVEARQGGADTARATLNFEAGQTTLGPVAIAPAPRVYQGP